MGPDASANNLCVGDARPLGDGANAAVFAEQIVRPTGLIDPPVIIRPTDKQVDDLLAEVHEVVKKGHARVGDNAHQEDGRSLDRVYDRGRHQGALYPFGC